MKETLLILFITGIIVWFRQRGPESGPIRLPSWVWNALTIFMVYMSVRHAKEVFQFFTQEADAWWPIVKSNAQDLTKGLRQLFLTMKEGTNK